LTHAGCCNRKAAEAVESSTEAYLVNIWLVPQSAEEDIGITQSVLGYQVLVGDEAVALHDMQESAHRYLWGVAFNERTLTIHPVGPQRLLVCRFNLGLAGPAS
jgi:hypothetical protein